MLWPRVLEDIWSRVEARLLRHLHEFADNPSGGTLMASPWGPIGNAAVVAQLLGLDAVSLIALIVQAAANARMHKTKCKAFSDYVQIISRLIEPFDRSEFDAAPVTRVPLQRLEDALRKSYLLVKSCQDRSFPYLFIMGWKIEGRFRTAEEEIDRYLKLIPLVNLAEFHKLKRERRGWTRKDQPQHSTYADPVQNAPSSYGRSLKGALYRIFKFRESLNDQIRVASEKPEVSREEQLRIFRLNELRAATNGFAEKNIIGRGEFTIVYRGIVDNIPVAVKKWESYADGLQEWENEMNVLCHMRHPNLIKLLGCCNGDNEIILVYELMKNGDLEQFLNRGNKPLSWEQRIKIATSTARALAFLHTPENNIIHRVIKPSIILLDSEFDVKLSGLGCSRQGPTDGATGVSTQLIGMAGYIDPQYAMTGHLDAKTDVYAFGIVMLQLLSGLKVFDSSRPLKERHLVLYASGFTTDRKKLHKFMDPTLRKQYQLNDAFRLVELCELCTSYDGDYRPCMETILEVLESICPGTS